MKKSNSSGLLFALIFFLLLPTITFAQTDSRYDAGMNLPFNEKAGDVNPQTGDVSLGFTDVSLPGRGGMHFSFGRSWSLTRSNVFNMYWNPDAGNNRLDSTTVELQNNLGAGWSTNLPCILSDTSSGSLVLTLFFDGAYQIDQSGVSVDDPGRSNLLYYDLTDKRIYEKAAVKYGDVTDLQDLRTSCGVDDGFYDYNKYVLALKDNFRYYFREDGKLMKQTDPAGVNSIWYFYDADDRLCLVVDTVGRKITFTHDANGNLYQVSWDVDIMTKNGETRQVQTITKTVTYHYESALNYSDVSNLYGAVQEPKEEPYVLTGVTDPMGNTTAYTWETGTIGFTYDKDRSHWQNVYMMLTSVCSVYTNDGGEKYLNKRCFEYSKIDNSAMYRKTFYAGYMENYRVARQYSVSRSGRVMNDTRYSYYADQEAGNYNQYSAVIQTGGVTTTYAYAHNSGAEKDHTLSSLVVETEDGFSQATDYTYDEKKAKLGEKVSRNGHPAWEEHFNYDRKGNLTWQKDRRGKVTDIQYDPDYSIPVREAVKVTIGEAIREYVTERELDGAGRVIRESILHENNDGSTGWIHVNRITWDAYGNPITQTDAVGNVVHTVYDTSLHAFPVKDYRTVTIDSWSGGGTVHDNWLTDPNGTAVMTIRSWKVFNSDGSVWLEVDNEGYAVEHFYDLYGTEIGTVNPDDDDIPVPSGEDHDDFRDFSTYASFLANRAGNPGARMYINYQSDFIHKVADIDAVTKKVTGVQKDGLGHTEAEKEYKVLGSFTESDITDPNLAVFAEKKMVYDNLGRMIALTDPDAGSDYVLIRTGGEEVAKHDKTWIVTYDDLGRTEKVLYPRTRPGITSVKQVFYDDVENSVTTIGPEGRKVKEIHDWNGNLIELVAYGDYNTPADEAQHYYYTYDELDRKVSFTDPKGHLTTYRYDERNLLLEQYYGASGSDLMTYDKLGLLVEKTDRKGNRIVFIYDEMGRNTSVIHYDAENLSVVARQVDTVYDNRGNAVRISNEELIEHYLYNHANMVTILQRRLTDQSVRSGAASVFGGNEADQIFSFTYDYNDAGMVTQMTCPDGAQHTFAYESGLGRLAEIGEGADAGSVLPFVTGFEYNKSGVVTRMDYSNSTWQTWEFDNRKRISHIGITGPGGTIEDLTYTLNGAGDILSVNDNEYTYDGFDRISGARTRIPTVTDQVKLVEKYFGTYSDGDPIDGVSYDASADLDSDGRVNGADHVLASLQTEGDVYDVESFTYDRNGNRTKLVQNGDEYAYTYGERNRLLSISRKKKGETAFSLYVEYQYDENGNTTKRTIYKDEGLEDITFEYDTMNRLVRTTNNGEVTEYRYDNAGNRFIKIAPEATTVYLRHGQIAVAMDIEVNSDQTTQKGTINRYVLSGDLLAGRVTTTVHADDTTTVEKSWYHLDHLNSTKCVTDASGTIVVNYTYRAFGEQLKRLDASGNETSDEAKYSYGGKELDEVTNLYYFNARYYDATIGRFINVDPVQDGSNWYVYCSNNPLSFVDPTGLEEHRKGNLLDLIFLPFKMLFKGIELGGEKKDNGVITPGMKFKIEDPAEGIGGEIGASLGGYDDTADVTVGPITVGIGWESEAVNVEAHAHLNISDGYGGAGAEANLMSTGPQLKIGIFNLNIEVALMGVIGIGIGGDLNINEGDLSAEIAGGIGLNLQINWEFEVQDQEK